MRPTRSFHMSNWVWYVVVPYDGHFEYVCPSSFQASHQTWDWWLTTRFIIISCFTSFWCIKFKCPPSPCPNVNPTLGKCCFDSYSLNSFSNLVTGRLGCHTREAYGYSMLWVESKSGLGLKVITYHDIMLFTVVLSTCFITIKKHLSNNEYPQRSFFQLWVIIRYTWLHNNGYWQITG